MTHINSAQGFIDIHNHLLYGIDSDGPQLFSQTQDLLQQAARENISVIIATPHVAPGYRPFDWVLFQERLAETNAYSAEQGLGISVLPGCESLYTDQTADLLYEGKYPTLAGSTNVLVEFYPNDSFERIEYGIIQIRQKGFTPVLAHIERYHCLVRKPALVAYLADTHHAYMQVNSSNFHSPPPLRMRRFFNYLLKNRLIDAISSDAHHAVRRPAHMLAAYKRLSSMCEAEYVEAIFRFKCF